MQKKEVDVYLSLVIIAMLFFGLVMISSVSVYTSYRITSGLVARGLLDEPNNSWFMAKTVFNVIVAIAAMTIFSKIPYDMFEKYAKYIFAASLVGLLLVFVPGLESQQNGAK